MKKPKMSRAFTFKTEAMFTQAVNDLSKFVVTSYKASELRKIRYLLYCLVSLKPDTLES